MTSAVIVNKSGIYYFTSISAIVRLMHEYFVFKVSPELKTDRDVIMYRAYVAQRKFGVVLDEVTPAAPPELLAVRMFADFLSNDSKR